MYVYRGLWSLRAVLFIIFEVMTYTHTHIHAYTHATLTLSTLPPQNIQWFPTRCTCTPALSERSLMGVEVSISPQEASCCLLTRVLMPSIACAYVGTWPGGPTAPRRSELGVAIPRRFGQVGGALPCLGSMVRSAHSSVRTPFTKVHSKGKRVRRGRNACGFSAGASVLFLSGCGSLLYLNTNPTSRVCSGGALAVIAHRIQFLTQVLQSLELSECRDSPLTRECLSQLLINMAVGAAMPVAAKWAAHCCGRTVRTLIPTWIGHGEGLADIVRDHQAPQSIAGWLVCLYFWCCACTRARVSVWVCAFALVAKKVCAVRWRYMHVCLCVWGRTRACWVGVPHGTAHICVRANACTHWGDCLWCGVIVPHAGVCMSSCLQEACLSMCAWLNVREHAHSIVLFQSLRSEMVIRPHIHLLTPHFWCSRPSSSPISSHYGDTEHHMSGNTGREHKPSTAFSQRISEAMQVNPETMEFL